MQTMANHSKLLILGIDPGVKTGLAIWNKETAKLELLTIKIHQGFDMLREIKNEIGIVIIENPNLWTHFKNSKEAKAKLQGAGSIKRDFKIWTDFLDDEGIPYRAVRPDKNRNALAVDEKKFKQITGYTERSSEHARVAGLMAYLN